LRNPAALVLGQSGCCVLRSALTCFPASSGDMPWRLSASLAYGFRRSGSVPPARANIAGSAMVGQDMCGVEGGYLVQHGKPTRRCAAVAEDVRHGLVLHYVARISFSYYVLTCTVGIAPACHVAALLGYYGHPLACGNVQQHGGAEALAKTWTASPRSSTEPRTHLRDVHMASLSLARELRKPAFVLPPSRLHEIETKKMTPSVHRLYTLAYRCRLNELLSWFGIPPR
jgi:hypothetical protein